jgi:hypothetical protein
VSSGMLGTKVDYRVRIMLNLGTQRGIPVKCLIEASFLLPPPSFKISSALMPCSLLVSKLPRAQQSTYSSTEWERTGELRPSIAGVAKALTGVEASVRREVEAPFERSGRRFLSIVMCVAIGAVQ